MNGDNMSYHIVYTGEVTQRMARLSPRSLLIIYDDNTRTQTVVCSWSRMHWNAHISALNFINNSVSLCVIISPTPHFRYGGHSPQALHGIPHCETASFARGLAPSFEVEQQLTTSIHCCRSLAVLPAVHLLTLNHFQSSVSWIYWLLGLPLLLIHDCCCHAPEDAAWTW